MKFCDGSDDVTLARTSLTHESHLVVSMELLMGESW